ncbi:MAG: DUF503 domain-containing protein [Phycisphaerae bacterium]
MIVGVLTARMGIYESRSLKDKRRVTRSLKDRIRRQHNVSIAEVDDLEHRQAATFGIAVVSNEARVAQQVLDSIVGELQAYVHASLLEFDIEML